MTWNFWYCFTIIFNLSIIFIESKPNSPSLIIENIIPEKINQNLLRIDIKKGDGTVLYQLELKKTKGILATSKTPIIKYIDDITNKEKLIKFYPDYEVMQGIGNFSFYHDIDNKASAVLFSDSDGLYLDGIIGDVFRLNRFPVNYLNNVLKKSQQHFIRESNSNIESLDENTLSTLNNVVQNVGAYYPELLIVLDYNLLVNTSKIEVIKKQLVYWNAVDMLFASMKSPEIYLNIAAFILPSSKYAFPFLENDPGTKFVDFYNAIEGIEELFYNYRDQISIDYDIIVAMTGAKLCVRPTRASPVMNCINGFAEAKPDITNKFDDEREAVDSTAILHFDNQVSSYTNAAQKIGFMFTGEFTRKKEQKKCPGIMEEYYRRGKFSLSWSTCTQTKVTNYLESPKAEALKNFPKYILKRESVQMIPTEPPKPSKGWLGSLNNWLFSKNKDKKDEVTDVISTTEPFLYGTTNSIISTKAYLSEVTKQMPEINDVNVDLHQEFTTSEASSSEQIDLGTTKKPFLSNIIEDVLELSEKISKINNSIADLQQEWKISKASTSEQINLIATTEASLPKMTLKIPEITEQLPEINNNGVDLQQDFTNSEVRSDNLPTTLNPSVYSTLEPSSENFLKGFKDDINTISSPSGYFPLEPSSENDRVNDTSEIPTPGDYSTAKHPSKSFFGEDKSVESPSFESRVEEDPISTLELVNTHSELKKDDLLSTTVESLIEKRQQAHDNYIFVDVTVPSTEDKIVESPSFESRVEEDPISTLELVNTHSELKKDDLSSTTVESLIEKRQQAHDNYIFVDVTAPGHTDVSENDLVKSTVSSELNQSSVSAVDPAIEEHADREKRQDRFNIDIPEASNKKGVNEREKQPKFLDNEAMDFERSDQEILPSDQEVTRTSDEVLSTLKPDKTLSDPKVLASEKNLSTFKRLKRLHRSQIEDESSLSNLINTETTEELSMEHYSNQDDSVLDINTFSNNEVITQSIIEEYSNQNDSLLDFNVLNNNKTMTESVTEQYFNQDATVVNVNTSTTLAPLLVTLLNRVPELNDSSTEMVQYNSTTVDELIPMSVSTASSTESTPSPSCKQEKMNLDVTLQLNINTNDKNIKTLKKSFHGGSLDQENENTTDTNDNNRVIRNIINYLLEHSDR